MKTPLWTHVKHLLIYYCKAAVFSVLSYILIYAVYGGVGISILSWAMVVMVAFTFAYIPLLIKYVKIEKSNRKEGE